MEPYLEELNRSLRRLRTSVRTYQFVYFPLGALVVLALLFVGLAEIGSVHQVGGVVFDTFEKNVPKWMFGIVVSVAAVLAIGLYDGQERARGKIAVIEQQIDQNKKQLEELRRLFFYPGEQLSIATKRTKPITTKKLQILLGVNGFVAKVDGDFGTDTEKIVLAAQNRFGIASDGIVGSQTWNRFLEEAIKLGKASQLLDAAHSL